MTEAAVPKTKERSCSWKMRFGSACRAKAAINRMREQGQGGDRLAVYSCPHCGGWHVGNNKYERGKKWT